MAAAKSDLFKDTVRNTFQRHNEVVDEIVRNRQGNPSKAVTKSGNRREIELAAVVLLVDVASADQNFDSKEYQAISDGMRRTFGTSKEQVAALVQEAKTALANLRGATKYADILRDGLEPKERQAVFELIEEVIAADGQVAGFEEYLRQKFAKLLGITT